MSFPLGQSLDHFGFTKMPEAETYWSGILNECLNVGPDNNTKQKKMTLLEFH